MSGSQKVPTPIAINEGEKTMKTMEEDERANA
jgi:hypothetical protein